MNPNEMLSSQLVNEYAEAKMRDARGQVSSQQEHARHCSVVDELRARHLL